jgi:hypothetical protein
MNKYLKRLEVFVLVVIIAVIGIIYAFRQKSALAPTTQTTQTTQTSDQQTQTTPSGSLSINTGEAPPPTQLVPSATIQYSGVDGKNALTLLQVGHRVDVKHYSFGDMVTGIDGVTPDSNHFWAMYVNGQFSQVGASSYITKNSDTIKWEIDAVVNTK